MAVNKADFSTQLTQHKVIIRQKHPRILIQIILLLLLLMGDVHLNPGPFHHEPESTVQPSDSTITGTIKTMPYLIMKTSAPQKLTQMMSLKDSCFSCVSGDNSMTVDEGAPQVDNAVRVFPESGGASKSHIHLWHPQET